MAGNFMNLNEIQQTLFPQPKVQHLGNWNVMVNGKIWTKNGAPVEFPTRSAAQKVADTIMARYQKATQVIPVK